MAQHANVVPDSSSFQPPSYEECMGTQPPRYPQSVGPTGGPLHPPPPPHAYVANTGMSEYERAKRERKRRLLTIGLVGTLCTIFLFIILYIKLNLYHEAQRRHMQNHLRMENVENSYWPVVPERTYYQQYYPRIDSPRVSTLEMDDIQQQLKKFLNDRTQLFNPTETSPEAETDYSELASESSTNESVTGTSD